MIDNFYPKLENWINSKEYQEKKEQEKKDISAIKKFVKKYNIQTIEKMEIENYLFNYGNNATFCGMMKKLVGSIGGQLTPPQLFGIVWSKENKRIERNDRYNGKRLGKNNSEVFANSKKWIAKAIRDSNNRDLTELSKNGLNSQFVSKIAFVYNFNYQLPIYAETHIDKLLDIFGIAFDKKENIQAKRQKLFDFWNTDELIQERNISPILFMYFVYSEQGYSSILKKGSKRQKQNITFIDGVAGEKIHYSVGENSAKHEYLTDEEKKIIGTSGEEVVLNYLTKNRAFFEIKGNIEVFCFGEHRDDTKGYDFKYSTKQGNIIFVEAKTTTLKSKEMVRFEMSLNEYKMLISNKEKYYIFFVSDVYGNPVIQRFRGDSLIEPDPTKYLFYFKIKND